MIAAATFTSAEWVQILVAIGVLITTTGGVVVSIVNSARIAKVDAKADVITGHVNSAASAAAAKIEALQKEVAALVATVAERKQDAALLAQAVVQTSGPTPVIVENPVSKPVPTVVKKLDPKRKV